MNNEIRIPVTIGGVEFKIKMDCYKPGHFISDLKYLASLKSHV